VRLLLDTHAFLWWLVDAPSLSRIARAAIEDTGNSVFIRAATAWEIVTKHRIGKLPDVAFMVTDVGGSIAR
jgi:PIN domain nuclease of toxin-antitoxin system